MIKYCWFACYWLIDINSASAQSSSSKQLVRSTPEATHRGLHKFTPRHADEIDIDIGDPVYVQNEADDCWCEGLSFSIKFRI